jgi:hypothetical protein
MLIDELDEKGEIVKSVNEDGSEVSKKVLNPDFQAFEKDFNELLQTEKDVEYKGFKLSEFEKVETSENYETFFRMVTVE